MDHDPGCAVRRDEWPLALLWQGRRRNLTTGSSITASNNNTNSGWLVGAGIEWAFAPNWSAKVEYNYLGLDDRTFTVPAGSPFLAGDTFTQSNRNIDGEGRDQLPVQLERLPLL